jgi:hypothetical protein
MGPVFSLIILQPADKKDSTYNPAFPNTGVVTVVVGSRRSDIPALFLYRIFRPAGLIAHVPSLHSYQPVDYCDNKERALRGSKGR